MKAGTPALLLPQSSEAAPLFGRLRKGAEEHFILPESACLSLQRSNTQFSPAQLLPSLCIQSLSLLSRDNPVIEEWEGWSRKTGLSHSCWRKLLCNLEATRFRDSRNQEIAMGDATSWEDSPLQPLLKAWRAPCRIHCEIPPAVLDHLLGVVNTYWKSLRM